MKDFVERLQDILKTEPEDIIKVRNLLDKAKEENKRLREEIKNLEEMIEMTNCMVCTGYLITKKVLRQYRDALLAEEAMEATREILGDNNV